MYAKSLEMTVQFQPNTGDELDLLQRIRRDVSAIVDLLDTRFHYLIKEEARDIIPPEEVAGELLLLARDLKRCFRRLVEVEERHDLSFRAAMELQEIDRHCVWLFRKLRTQQASLKRLGLEARLRELVAAEAFNIYQTLLSVDEEERQSLANDDTRIRSLLLEDKE